MPWTLLLAFAAATKAPVPIWFTSMYLHITCITRENTVNMFLYHSLYWLNRCIQLACLGSCSSISKAGLILKETLPLPAALPTTKCWSHCSFPSSLWAKWDTEWLCLFHLCISRARHDDVKPNAWESVWHILLALKKLSVGWRGTV